MRSKSLTKTVAITPLTLSKLSELKNKFHLRTYDDVINYVLGDIPPITTQEVGIVAPEHIASSTQAPPL